jgi:proton-translocating NADH-quinone oxidoreductase chain L
MIVGAARRCGRNGSIGNASGFNAMSGSWPAWLYVAAVLVPLGAFVVQFLGLRVLGRANAWLATLAIGAALVLSLIGLVFHIGGLGAAPGADAPPPVWALSTDWLALGGQAAVGLPPLVLRLGVHIDRLAVIMFAMVTFIATLIHVYSMGYMKEDPGYPRFFAFLSLFCFSMLGLVASSTIFQVFIFWELVGLCSYLLIGFWYREKANVDAANKAFIVNRVGDIGMLIGLGVLWSTLGTFSIAEINEGLRDHHGMIHERYGSDGVPVAELRDRETGQPIIEAGTGRPRQITFGLLTIAGLGVFAGCVGKSAQVPLHVWLPDAMAGPTPVSALIHAATMVAAGVYLVGRFFPLFTTDALTVIAYTGAVTLFIAATIACVQADYKKVLAYSTVSQLGFMMLGLGVGGWAAGLFHLITHAFFKALLFLGAGSVYHAVHTYDVHRLGGLRRKMPITALTMLAGTLAIAGVPFFSGFYSKDAILMAVIAAAREDASRLPLLVMAVVGAVLTAFYMFRMYFLLFAGAPRDHHLADHAHESPWSMTLPLVLLAVPAVAIGWPVGIVPVLGGMPVLERLLETVSPLEGHAEGGEWVALGASLAIVTVGTLIAAAGYLWRAFDPAKAARAFGPIHALFVNKWYFDDLYRAVLVRPSLALGRLASSLVDRGLIDGLLHGLVRATTSLSRLDGWVDREGVDGLVVGLGRTVERAGDVGRRLQTGRVRQYLLVLSLGLVALFAGLARWVLAGG